MTRQKQVEITDDILAQIERVTSTTVDPDNIVVFEAAAASTRAIHKAGSLYHGARMSRTLLSDMAQALNSGSESVPLHTMHQQGHEIPKGRVFQASISDEIDGSTTLKAMFYLPLMEKELIEKINLSILDEVSIGLKSEQALCSKCGFDYFGPDADFGHLFSQTCDNDHTLDGADTHLKLVGLDKWMELSLVSRGASDKPKILSRAKQLVSADEYDRMAADGKPAEALILFTSMATETPQMPKTKIEFDAEGAITALTATITELAASVEALSESEPDDVQTQLDAALAEIAEMKAAAAEEETAAELAAAALVAEEEAAALAASEAEAAAVAAAIEAQNIPTPAGGVSASSIGDAKHPTANLSGRSTAFKTKR